MSRGERMVAGDYDSMRLINEVLTLYYFDNLTQAEVGQRLGLSTAKVNRLLQQARSQGMIEISIRLPFQRLFDLEARLKAIFRIRDAVVIPRITDNVNLLPHTLGRAGAHYLLEHLGDGDILAIGGGTGVHAVAQALETQRAYDVRVVPTIGGVQGQVTTDVNFLAMRLAEGLGGRAFQLHAPAFVDSQESRDALMSVPAVKDILDIARCANIALMGVGTVDPEKSRFVQFTALAAGDMRQIADRCGGVGEVGAYVYDARGHPCAPSYAARIVGLTLPELRRIPVIVGIAATAAKALPIYGALRGGYLDVLITDEAAAEGVVDLFERDFRGEVSQPDGALSG